MAVPDFRTPAQLAEKYTWTSRSAIYGAMKDGLLPYYRFPSGKGKKGKLLVKEAEFLAFVESTRTEGAQADDGPLRHIR